MVLHDALGDEVLVGRALGEGEAGEAVAEVADGHEVTALGEDLLRLRALHYEGEVGVLEDGVHALHDAVDLVVVVDLGPDATVRGVDGVLEKIDQGNETHELFNFVLCCLKRVSVKIRKKDEEVHESQSQFFCSLAFPQDFFLLTRNQFNPSVQLLDPRVTPCICCVKIVSFPPFVPFQSFRPMLFFEEAFEGAKMNRDIRQFVSRVAECKRTIKSEPAIFFFNIGNGF